MNRPFRSAGFVLFLSGLAFAQTAPTSSTFELADVHASPATRFVFLRNPLLHKGLYELRYATMVDLIRIAYGVDAERVVGGPSWLENEWFDLLAKVPAGTTMGQIGLMLQALLAERFKLAVHNDTKSIPAFVLKAGKRPQLKPSDGSGDTGCRMIRPEFPASGPLTTALAYGHACRNMTMEAFAAALGSSLYPARQYVNQKLVVDRTELKGAWDFDFKITPRGMMGPDGPLPGAITLFDAMEKLGLKLEPADVSFPVIVVDSVNEKPTANPPGTEEALYIAPPPREFEVADLKPSAPDLKGMDFQIRPGGRVNIAGMTVKSLIEEAWQVEDDMLVGAPKWMDTDRYDIVAKASTDGPQMDTDIIWPMLEALLKERFGIAVHREQRPANAYTLVAVKPKMKKADPSSRTKYKEGPAEDGKDPRDKNPVLGRLVTCQNMTMAQFAAKLQLIAPGYIRFPVLDATGLQGGYDFTLSFSPAGAVQMAGRGGRGGGETGDAPAAASDPNGAITLFEAIEKQLGLKLEAQKRPVEVLVIDRAEQKPTEN